MINSWKLSRSSQDTVPLLHILALIINQLRFLLKHNLCIQTKETTLINCFYFLTNSKRKKNYCKIFIMHILAVLSDKANSKWDWLHRTWGQKFPFTPHCTQWICLIYEYFHWLLELHVFGYKTIHFTHLYLGRNTTGLLWDVKFLCISSSFFVPYLFQLICREDK